MAAASATTTAAAQNAPEPGESTAPPTTPAPSSWRTYPRERHLLLRVEAMSGLRLQDYFAQGSFAPVSVLAQGSFTFLHLGSVMLGPSLGAQVGFDRAGTQIAIQPGITAYRRFSGHFALTGRIDANILVTRGVCDPQMPLPVLMSSWRGLGIPANQGVVPAPSSGYCPTIAFGGEAALGAAYFIRSGLALAGEVTFNMYGGDGGLTYPIVGVALGVLFDREVLP